MKTFRTLVAAFSLYSRFPTPDLAFTEEDLKRTIVFLPLVGAVIGAIILAVQFLLNSLEYPIPLLARCALILSIPLLSTGGFHLDGFMDVQDARRSYKSKEEKLAIMRDPRVGAFAIIDLLILGTLWTAALATILEASCFSCVAVYAISFFVVRALCALCALRLRHARRDGMLNLETQSASSRDFWILVVEACVGVVAMLLCNATLGCAVIVALAFFTLYYRRMCYRHFDGVTGDTSGYFVVVGEFVALAAAALSQVAIQNLIP
ncbi:MAG: adenosylcobinamide-GDP ribazoletransferase [Thermoguttaceae bacterium]|jgi:adenosylcobinamide-GDP ribazoletransferase